MSNPLPNANVPQIPTPMADLGALARVCQALKQGMDSLAGYRGSTLDRAVTFRDLINLNLVSQAATTATAGITTVGAGGELVKPYVVSGFTGPVALSAGQVVFGHQFPTQVTFPADFGAIAISMTSECGAFANASGSTVLSIQKCPAASDPTVDANWTEIGTASFGAGGHAGTLATSTGTVVFSANDRMRWKAPTPADHTLAQIFMALVGRR